MLKLAVHFICSGYNKYIAFTTFTPVVFASTFKSHGTPE